MALIADVAVKPPDHPVVDLLQQSIRWFHSEAGESGFGSKLKQQMVEQSVDVVAVAGDWIERCRATDPMLAWSLLYAIDQFSLSGAVDLYAREALRSIHFDPLGACQQFGDVDALVGVQASEALSRRVGIGEQGARDALLAVVANQQCVAIQTSAALAFRAVDPAVVEELVSILGDRADCLSWRPVLPEDMTVSADFSIETPNLTQPPNAVRPRTPKGYEHG